MQVKPATQILGSQTQRQIEDYLDRWRKDSFIVRQTDKQIGGLIDRQIDRQLPKM